MALRETTPTLASRDIEVKDVSIRRAILAPEGGARFFEAAMQPYKVALSETADGVKLDGDQIAVSIAASEVASEPE